MSIFPANNNTVYLKIGTEGTTIRFNDYRGKNVKLFDINLDQAVDTIERAFGDNGHLNNKKIEEQYQQELVKAHEIFNQVTQAIKNKNGIQTYDNRLQVNFKLGDGSNVTAVYTAGAVGSFSVVIAPKDNPIPKADYILEGVIGMNASPDLFTAANSLYAELHGK